MTTSFSFLFYFTSSLVKTTMTYLDIALSTILALYMKNLKLGINKNSNN